MDNMYLDVLVLFKRHRKYNTKVISAVIESLERFNRPLLWRLIEYTVFFFLAIINNTLIDNYSIGRYQIKIAYILDYLNIEYTFEKKRIIISEKLDLNTICAIIYLSNRENVLLSLLQRKFPEFNLDTLSDEQLKAIFLYYSRNVKFDDGPNYYTFGKKLYSEEVNYYIV